MINPRRPTLQPHVGTLYRPRECSDAWVMNSNKAKPLAERFEDVMSKPWEFASTRRCRLARHACPYIKKSRITSCAHKVSKWAYAQPDGVTTATATTKSAPAAAGLSLHSGTGTADNPPAVKSERCARQVRFQAQFRGSQRVPYGP